MTHRNKSVALSAILGMVIGLGLTGAAGGGLYYVFQEQSDLFATSSNVEIKNLNAIQRGGELTITANLKNVGSTSITDVHLSELTSGEKYKISYTDGADATDCKYKFGNTGLNISPGISDNKFTASGGNITQSSVEIVSGISHCGEEAVPLQGGQTKALKFTIVSPYNNNVLISDRLTIQLSYISGQDTLQSDIYNTRVRPG